MRRIFIDDKNQLEYEILGSPDNHSIVLIPPGIGNITDHRRLRELFVDQYQVITFNMPGTGKSVFTHTCTMDKIADVVAHAITSLNLDRPTIIGESYGACVALLVANKIPTSKLVLITPGEFFTNRTRFFFKAVFFPARSRRVRKYISKTLALLQKHKINYLANQFVLFPSCTDKQLENIFSRWMDLLSYRLPKIKIPVKTWIFNSTNELYVDKNSRHKVYEIVNVKNIVDVDVHHVCMIDGIIQSKKQEFVDAVTC